MKKLILFGAITLSAVAMAAYLPEYFTSQIAKSEITQVRNIYYSEYVNSTGEISLENKKYIATDFPFMVEDVHVEKGQEVEVGDLLVTINREESAKQIYNLSSLSVYSNEEGEFVDMTYEDIFASIPSQVVSTAKGTIDEVYAFSGQFLGANDEIASFMSDTDKIATLNVPEDKISKIEVGQIVEITGSGFENEIYYGEIKSISSSATKIFSGTKQETVVPVVVAINGADNLLKEGYTVEGKIIVEDKISISVLPYESILQDDDGNEFVYVFKDGIAERKDIITGLELSDAVEVISGVNYSENVLLNPDEVENNGDPVFLTE